MKDDDHGTAICFLSILQSVTHIIIWLRFLHYLYSFNAVSCTFFQLLFSGEVSRLPLWLAVRT